MHMFQFVNMYEKITMLEKYFGLVFLTATKVFFFLEISPAAVEKSAHAFLKNEFLI